MRRLHTRDGRPVIQPQTLPSGQWHYWHGVGDSATALRAGSPFRITNDGSGDGVETVEWRYRDPVWMAGGRVRYKDADLGDEVSMKIYAPATPVTPNGGGTGNCNVVNAQGLPGQPDSVIIVPAAGDGGHDVNLAACHPVPAPSVDGYWAVTLPDDFKGASTVEASASPGAASYHLLTIPKDLVQFVANEQLLGNGLGEYEPQNINVSLCLPEWRFECRSKHAGGMLNHTLKLTWRVLVSRYWTTE